MIRAATCALLLSAALAAPAGADTWSAYAAVQCGADAVAIRNGGQFNEDPPSLYTLPEPHAVRWANVPVAADGRCKLSTGETVVVRFDWSPSRLTGPGALSPPVAVSVWIDGRKILSRELVQGGYAQAFTGPFLNSLFVTRDAIERCPYREGLIVPGDEDPAGVVCARTALDLAAIPRDPLQPSPETEATPKFTVAATYNPDFCALFIRRAGDAAPDTPRPYADDLVIAPPAGATYPFPRDAAPRTDGFTVETARFDYWNDGQERTVLRLWLHDPLYSYSDHVFLNLREPDEAAIAAFTDIARTSASRSIADLDLPALQKLGWYTPARDSETASYRVFRLDGMTFYLTTGLDRSNPVLLVRPGARSRTETVCTFQERRTNY